MLSNRDYEFKKAELRLRIELQRQDMSDSIRDVRTALNPWISVAKSIRSGVTFIGPVTAALGLAIPFISLFFGKKNESPLPPSATKPSKISAVAGYVFPALKFALKFLVK